MRGVLYACGHPLRGEGPLAACSERGGHSEWGQQEEGFEGGSMYAEWGGRARALVCFHSILLPATRRWGAHSWDGPDQFDLAIPSPAFCPATGYRLTTTAKCQNGERGRVQEREQCVHTNSRALPSTQPHTTQASGPPPTHSLARRHPLTSPSAACSPSQASGILQL